MNISLTIFALFVRRDILKASLRTIEKLEDVRNSAPLFSTPKTKKLLMLHANSTSQTLNDLRAFIARVTREAFALDDLDRFARDYQQNFLALQNKQNTQGIAEYIQVRSLVVVESSSTDLRCISENIASLVGPQTKYFESNFPWLRFDITKRGFIKENWYFR